MGFLCLRTLPLLLPALSLALPATAATTPPRIDFLAASRGFATDDGRFAVRDLDGDGDEDLIQLPFNGTSYGGDPHAYWIEHLGGRQFGELRLAHLAPTAAGQALGAAELMDLSGDATLEIFASRYDFNTQLYSPLSLKPALEDGAAASVEPTALTGSSLTPWHLVDLEGFGQPHLVQITGASGAGTATVRIVKRLGRSETYADAMVIETSYFEPSSISRAIGHDFDGDGDADLALESAEGYLLFFERTSFASFKPQPHVLSDIFLDGEWIDLDGDGLVDYLNFDGTWQRNLGSFTFAGQPVSSAWAVQENLAFRKITPRAGQSAIVQAIVMKDGEDGGSFELLSIPFDAAEPLSRQTVGGKPRNYPVFLHYGDLDGDAQPDLVYSYSAIEDNYYGSRILAVAWGSPSGFSAPQVIYAGPSNTHRVFSADFNGDQAADLVSGPDALGRYRIHFNRGAAGYDEGTTINGLDIPGTELRILGAARIDKDKQPDLVCSYTRLPVGADRESAIVVVRGRKDGSFIPPGIPAGGLVFTNGMGLDGGGMGSENFVDWDRDGDLDLVAWGLWQENVNGSFPGNQRLLVELGTMPDFLGNPATVGGTIVGDLDGDRAPDIISLIHGTGTATEPPKTMLIAFNDGRGGIEETLELPIQFAGYDFLGNPTVIGTAVMADLNADQRLDLWIRQAIGTDPSGNPITADRWLRNPGRRHARDVASWVSTPLQSDKVPPGVAFGDFDGDRKAVNRKKSLGEWVSPWGYLQPTRSGPLLSPPHDFTNGFIDLTKEPYAGGLDVDADRDTDFFIGGGDFPLLILRNPSAEAGKRRPLKVKEVPWLGSLPVVR